MSYLFRPFFLPQYAQNITKHFFLYFNIIPVLASMRSSLLARTLGQTRKRTFPIRPTPEFLISGCRHLPSFFIRLMSISLALHLGDAKDRDLCFRLPQVGETDKLANSQPPGSSSRVERSWETAGRRVLSSLDYCELLSERQVTTLKAKTIAQTQPANLAPMQLKSLYFIALALLAALAAAETIIEDRMLHKILD